MLEKSLQSETNRRLDGKTVVDVNREQAEAALREQAERFERLFDSTPLSYQSLSKDGSFIEVNDTWCETFGFDRKDVVGKNFSDFITEDSVRAFLYEFPCFLTEGEIHGVEFEIVTKQGDPVNVLLEGKISNNPDGTFRGTHCILQDITELKKVDQEQQTFERKLQHMQKLESLGLLAGGIAHDFNNLLMTIIGNADLALLDLPESSPARENLKEIEKASTRAAELAMQMLAYSGKAKFQRAKICLNEIVSDMSSLLKASVTKSTTFDTSLSEQVPTIYADPTQLRQVAMNLITNASEAIGENNGTITVSTGDMYCNRSYLDATSLPENQVEGIYAFLSVTDDGCGMDSDTMHKLFDPFFTTKFTGRGLGLAATVGKSVV